MLITLILLVYSHCLIFIYFFFLFPANSLLKLEEGVTYVYNLDGTSESSVPKAKGPFGDSVKVNLKATVEVTGLPQSKALIKLKNVQVTDPDSKVNI